MFITCNVKYYLKHCRQNTYTAQGESQVANIAQDKASAIFVMRLSSRAVYFIRMKQQCFKCFIVFYIYVLKCQQNTF